MGYRNFETLMSADTVLELISISKSFEGVLANRGINFDVREGEIHGLFGENGSGKTTLMNIASGLYANDSGVIRYKGKPVHFRSPLDALELGIGMVHQEFNLSENNTGIENVLVGAGRVGFLLRSKKALAETAEISVKYGLDVNLEAPVCTLSVGEKQKIELLKTLVRGVSLLILDEPTAVLTRLETVRFFDTLKLFRNRGGSIVFISHKLDEVLELCDRITILRRGAKVAEFGREQADKSSLALAMMGEQAAVVHGRSEVRAKNECSGQQKKQVGVHAPVLCVRDLRLLDGRGAVALEHADFDLRECEILGVAGVSGSGQTELCQVLSGLEKPFQGEISFMGKQVKKFSAQEMLSRGIAFIPQDRKNTGTVPDLSISENLILRKRHLFTISGILNHKAIKQFALDSVQKFGIKCQGIESRTANLSGGNLQKVVIARELKHTPKILIAAYPTRGLDIGAIAETHEILKNARLNGAAILLFSEDIEEILCLSDKIGVLARGCPMRIVEKYEATPEKIGLMMGGIA